MGPEGWGAEGVWPTATWVRGGESASRFASREEFQFRRKGFAGVWGGARGREARGGAGRGGVAGAGAVALTLLKPHQKPVECFLEAQRAALKVTRAQGGMLMRVALDKVQVWRVLPGPMLELHVTMGSSQGVLKFQNREATTEADIRQIARIISEAKGVEPEEDAPSMEAGAGRATDSNTVAASGTTTPPAEADIQTQGVGPSLAAKKHRASVVAASNMLTLMKLKKEREAIEKMADPDLEPAEKERLRKAAQRAVRSRHELVALKVAAPPPTVAERKEPVAPAKEAPTAPKTKAAPVATAASATPASLARLERELSISNERLNRKGAALESTVEKLKSAEQRLESLEVELEDARTRANESSGQQEDQEDELVGELVKVRAALSDSQRTIQEQDAYLKRVEERHEYEDREHSSRLSKAEDEAKAFRREIGGLENELSTLREQLASSTKKSGIDEKHLHRIQELQTESVEARKAEQEARAQARGATATCERLDADLNSLAQEHDSTVIAHQRAEEKAAALEEQNVAIECALAELRQELGTLMEEKSQADDDMQRVSSELRAELSRAQEDTTAREAAEAELVSIAEEKDRELRAALEESQRLQAVVNDLSEASENGERAVEALKREMAEKQELSNSLQALEEELAMRSAELKKSQAEVCEFAAKANEDSSALSDFQARAEALEVLVNNVEKLMKNGVEDLRDDLADTSGQWEQRLDGAEGAAEEMQVAVEDLAQSLQAAVARIEGALQTQKALEGQLDSMAREREDREASHIASSSSQLRELEELRQAHLSEISAFNVELDQRQSKLDAAEAGAEELQARVGEILENARVRGEESGRREERLSSLEAELQDTKSSLGEQIESTTSALEECQALLEQTKQTQVDTAEFLAASLDGCDTICGLVSLDKIQIENGLPALEKGVSDMILAVKSLKNFSEETSAELESKEAAITELNHQFTEVNDDLAKLQEEISTMEELRQELLRLQDIEESYNFLRPVQDAIIEMTPEHIAMRLGDAEVEIMKAKKRMSGLDGQNSDLADQLKRSRRLIDIAALRKESLEKELELNKRAANELRVKIEASDLQNRILKDSIEPATLATFNVSLAVEADVIKELPAVVEIWKGGLRLHEASLPSGSIAIKWETVLGWSVDPRSLTVHVAGTAPTDPERQLHLMLDRPHAIQMLNAMQHCLDAAIMEGTYTKPFALRTHVGGETAEGNPPSPGLSMTTPGIDEIRGVKEELSLIHGMLSSKLDQSVFRKELLESPEEAEGYVQSLEDSLAMADAMKEVLKSDMHDMRRKTLDTLKRLHAGLVLFLALGPDRENEKAAALVEMGNVVERHLEHQKGGLLPGGERAADLPPRAVAQLERLWKARLVDLEAKLQSCLAEQESLREAHAERRATAERLEQELEKQRQVEEERTSREAGAARLSKATELLQDRERPVGAALGALESQLEALRRDNAVLADLLRDSRETFGAQFRQEAGEVAALRARAQAPLLTGQPVEEAEVGDIAEMLRAAPALRTVPPGALQDLARYARFHEYRADEEVRRVGGGDVGVALVTEGCLQETAPSPTKAGGAGGTSHTLQLYEAGSHVLQSDSLAAGAWCSGLRCKQDASVFWVGAFELGLWLDRHGGLRAEVGPMLGDASGPKTPNLEPEPIVASETPQGPRALGALVIELQERLHVSEREKAQLRQKAAELQAAAGTLREEVHVQTGLKAKAQQQAHPRNQNERLERLERAMQAGEEIIRATPTATSSGARRLTVVELNLDELPSISPLEEPVALESVPSVVPQPLASAGAVFGSGRQTRTTTTGAVLGLSGPREMLQPTTTTATPAASFATPAVDSSYVFGSPFAPISAERPVTQQLREARGQIAQLSAGSASWGGASPASASGSVAPVPRSAAGSAHAPQSARQAKIERVCQGILRAVNR